MKTKIALLSLLVSTQLFAEDKLNIYPDVTQYVFEKQSITNEIEMELPDSYQLNSFYIEDKNGIVPKFYEFKYKSDIIFKENAEIIVAGQKYRFKKLIDNKLIVLDPSNKISVFNFNNLNSFNFENYETNKNAINLYNLEEKEMYYGSYLFGNVSFNYKKNLTIDTDNQKGYLNTEFVIVNNTDQEFKNVITSIMFEKISINEKRMQSQNINYQEQEIMYSKSMVANDNIQIENKEVGEKKSVSLGSLDIPANKTKIVKHLDNISFDFKYRYSFELNFDKKSLNIYPDYGIEIDRNKDNNQLFDIEAGEGYIYDKKSGLILNPLDLKKSEDKKLFIDLGKSNTTKLILNESKKFTILNPEEIYLRENYYKQKIDYIESEFIFENLKENSEIELITKNIFLLKTEINEEDLKFFKDKLNLFINSTTKVQYIREETDKLLREFLKDKLITMEDYKNSENYKNKKIYLIKINNI